ncbi:Uncharacterised protein [Salmonella enterica subsp. arizonae]|uniref:Uncharacterized protein n=1 Tax=Salmonella enterica subsp. arizonae TaxID=59203 RepID=A0A379TSD9_SALER|nr:Uncharacterised protein [Salmonella enterica subsp. arizonae]
MRFINFFGVTIFVMSFSTFSQNVSEYSKEYTDCIFKTVNNPHVNGVHWRRNKCTEQVNRFIHW